MNKSINEFNMSFADIAFKLKISLNNLIKIKKKYRDSLIEDIHFILDDRNNYIYSYDGLNLFQNLIEQSER